MIWSESNISHGVKVMLELLWHKPTLNRMMVRFFLLEGILLLWYYGMKKDPLIAL